jgi:hypothetical protein
MAFRLGRWDKEREPMIKTIVSAMAALLVSGAAFAQTTTYYSPSGGADVIER